MRNLDSYTRERPYSGNPIDCVLPPLQAAAGICSRERGDYRWQIMTNESMIANILQDRVCAAVCFQRAYMITRMGQIVYVQ